MLNWGFESPKEWLQMLTLNNLLHIHVKNNNDPWYVLAPISQLLLGQKSKVRTILKSWHWALFKTDLLLFEFGEDLMKILAKTTKKEILKITLYLPMLEFCSNNLPFYIHKFYVFTEEILFWSMFPMELFESIDSFELFD